MSGVIVGQAFAVGRFAALTATQRYVLVAYADNADRHGKCWPEKSEIVDKTGLSRATVYRAIATLQTLGYLKETVDEKGRECVFLTLSHPETDRLTVRQPPSHCETESSHSETRPSHSETPYIEEPSRTVKNRKTPPHPPRGESAVIEDLFDFWKSQTSRNGQTRLTPNRRKAIAARLAEGYDPELIRRAIAGAAASPWHRGENDRRRRFDDLTLICRSGEKLEAFAEMRPPRRALGGLVE